MENTQRPQGSFDAQRAGYPETHHDRRNLALHMVTVPLFIAGTVAVGAAPFSSFWLLPAGVVAIAAALAAQGKGHALEANAPAPFRGPLDFVARIFVEQWITFPRFVLSGAFARAWRDAT
jgi:hypothetical protein